MPRVYPPVWCHNNLLSNCNVCDDYLECDKKITRLLDSIKNSKKSRKIGATSIAIYYGYCQRLAKYFLSFPNTWPIPIIQKNFLDSTTGKRAKAEIQRILLDLIDHGDPNAPTDYAHELRLKLLLLWQKKTIGYVSDETGHRVEVNLSQDEANLLKALVEDWAMRYFANALTFQKTHDLQRCKYCFIANCETL